MSRVLYKLRVNEYVTDVSNHVYEAEQPLNVHFRIRYGEKPEDFEKSYTQKEIADMLDAGTFGHNFYFLYRDRCVFKKEWKVNFCFNAAPLGEQSIKISKIAEVRQQVNYIEKSPDDYTLAHLMKELSSTEFLDYLKDNNISIQCI